MQSDAAHWYVLHEEHGALVQGYGGVRLVDVSTDVRLAGGGPVHVIFGTGLLGAASSGRAVPGNPCRCWSTNSVFRVRFGVKICFEKSLYFKEPDRSWQNIRRRVAVKSADLAYLRPQRQILCPPPRQAHLL